MQLSGLQIVVVALIAVLSVVGLALFARTVGHLARVIRLGGPDPTRGGQAGARAYSLFAESLGHARLGRWPLVGVMHWFVFVGFVGLLLGAVWSPCVGPTLGAASLMAARGENLGQVALTMLAFGIGAGLPLAALGAARVVHLAVLAVVGDVDLVPGLLLLQGLPELPLRLLVGQRSLLLAHAQILPSTPLRLQVFTSRKRVGPTMTPLATVELARPGHV